MEIVLIRHGQPRWTVDGRARHDPGLTPLGQVQAGRVAGRLSRSDARPIEELLVSPAVRSQETSLPLVRATGVAPVTLDDLVEMRLPDWSEQPEEHVQRIFIEAQRRPPEQWWDGMTGGETFRDFHVRVTDLLGHVLAERGVTPDRQGRPHMWRDEGRAGRIVIVAHGGTNSVALTYLLGVEPTPWEWERFMLGHASIARVRTVPLADGHVFSLRSFNDQEHLARDERSR